MFVQVFGVMLSVAVPSFAETAARLRVCALENADGLKAEGENAEGENADGLKAEGENAEGENADGLKAEGENAEGENADGLKAEGENAEGENADGLKADGENAEGENADGLKADGENADGLNASPANSALSVTRSDGLVRRAERLPDVAEQRQVVVRPAGSRASRLRGCRA